jgi:hypothetical protein
MSDQASDIPNTASCWVRGCCAEYALALHDLHPRLRFGRHVETFPEDKEGDYIPWVTNHVFVHDDLCAYDSRGKHELPYDDPDPSWASVPAHVSTEYHVPRADIEAEWEIDADMLAAARRAIALADPVAER